MWWRPYERSVAHAGSAPSVDSSGIGSGPGPSSRPQASGSSFEAWSKGVDGPTPGPPRVVRSCLVMLGGSQLQALRASRRSGRAPELIRRRPGPKRTWPVTAHQQIEAMHLFNSIRTNLNHVAAA